jgi:(S)-sulfolactate dehydrogenase
MPERLADQTGARNRGKGPSPAAGGAAGGYRVGFMTRVVVAEFMDPAGVDLLAGSSDVMYDPTLVDDPDRLSDEVANCEALVVRNRTRVDRALLDRGGRLRAVGRLGVGLDNIDVSTCRARGIAVVTAGGANADAVAEYVIASLFALHRPALLRSAEILEGGWPRLEAVGVELAGRALGLVGLGGTAQAVARRAVALGMSVSGFDPYLETTPPTITRFGDLDALLESVDALSIHVPLVDETRGLIDAHRLGLMPPGAVVIDTSRGGVVDHPAVLDALRSGRLAGAALDVFPHEPPDPSPYRDVPNLILTPHIAGLTRQSNVRVAIAVATGVIDQLG